MCFELNLNQFYNCFNNLSKNRDSTIDIRPLKS